jgi:hypothetical protein
MTTIYVQNGAEIPGDSWVKWTTGAGQAVETQPMNMTPAQMTTAGVTTVVEDPMPDPFYGPVAKDPANPGKWTQTLYTPTELMPKLTDYSASIRVNYETGSIIVHPPTGSDYGAPTTRDVRSMVTSGLGWINAGTVTSATVKVMRVKTTSPPTYGDELFIRANAAAMTVLSNAMNKWTDLCVAQESTLASQINAGTITTKDQIDSAYLTMQQSNFPVAP